MSEIIIPIDTDFAQQIDTNCGHCIAGEGNAQQLSTLSQRSAQSSYPGERKALDGFREKCCTCLQVGVPELNSLTATYSCHYRVGIER